MAYKGDPGEKKQNKTQKHIVMMSFVHLTGIMTNNDLIK